MDDFPDNNTWVPETQIAPTPSLEAIARKARVSRSTVSRVLHNDSRISDATAQRVRGAAKALGYRPNPLLSVLMERVRVGRDLSYQGTIAVVTEVKDAARWFGDKTSWSSIHAGALRRAQERGYRLEYFSTQNYDPEGRRLSQVLQARDIHGVYVAPGFAERRLRLEWRNFSAATTGYGLVEPGLHRLCHNNYHGIQTACRRLWALGYKRIGLFLEQRQHEVTDHNYVAGFLLFLESVPSDLRIRPCLVQCYDRELFLEWYQRTLPDAVISNCDDIVSWVEAVGVSCPGDFGFAHLDHTPELSGFAGIDHNSELLGLGVVDLIIAQIHRGETGIPVHPMTMMVESFWVAGPTVRDGGPAPAIPSRAGSKTRT